MPGQIPQNTGLSQEKFNNFHLSNPNPDLMSQLQGNQDMLKMLSAMQYNDQMTAQFGSDNMKLIAGLATQMQVTNDM